MRLKIIAQGMVNIMNKILIIEDEETIREELIVLLRTAGYDVSYTELYYKALEKFNEFLPDLVLLDINLPEANGFNICIKIRNISKVPIIFITGRNNSIDELKAFSLGGDDYITKPYNTPVLIARISSVMRRSEQNNCDSEIISYKGIELNLATCVVKYNSKSVELSKKEMKILYYLISNKEKYISRISLIEYLWDQKIYTDDNALSVNVTRLREKFKEIGVDEFIKTKRGMGYMI